MTLPHSDTSVYVSLAFLLWSTFFILYFLYSLFNLMLSLHPCNLAGQQILQSVYVLIQNVVYVRKLEESRTKIGKDWLKWVFCYDETSVRNAKHYILLLFYWTVPVWKRFLLSIPILSVGREWSFSLNSGTVACDMYPLSNLTGNISFYEETDSLLHEIQC